MSAQTAPASRAKSGRNTARSKRRGLLFGRNRSGGYGLWGRRDGRCQYSSSSSSGRMGTRFCQGFILQGEGAIGFGWVCFSYNRECRMSNREIMNPDKSESPLRCDVEVGRGWESCFVHRMYIGCAVGVHWGVVGDASVFGFNFHNVFSFSGLCWDAVFWYASCLFVFPENC